jgi:hypothetical protein
MSALLLEIAVGSVCVIALKLMSGVATDMKLKMDTFHEEDPIVNLFAWLDRVTSFRRH